MQVGPGSGSEEALIIVAPTGWESRAAELVRAQLPEAADAAVRHCGNVYEGSAAVLLARRQGRRVTLCVMVDYLSRSEMDVFSVLEPVARTIGFSACGRDKKLAYARLLGADHVLGEVVAPLPRGKETATEAAVKVRTELEEPMSPTGAAVINAMASSAIASATQQSRRRREKAGSQGARPTEATPPESKDEPARQQPPRREGLLSQEELDALLG